MSTDPFPSPPSALDPEDEALLLDHLRGELAPRARRALEARLRREPALAAAAARLQRFQVAVRAASREVPEPGVATRIAVRVRDQVGAEEARARREGARTTSPRRLLWARILVLSLAAHVLVLGFVALRVRQDVAETPGPALRAVLPEAGLPAADEETAYEPTGRPGWQGVAAPSLPEPEGLVADLTADETDEDLVPLRDHLRDHPRSVALEMVTRRFDVLKRRRLDRFGLDAQGTLGAVQRGLRVLAHRQQADGAFPPGGGRSAVGQTALALLPFLADGHGSRTGRLGPEVAEPGIAWLRAALFTDDGTLRADVAAGTADLGMALRALSEDYVLSYGRLAVADARRRAAELERLTRELAGRQTADGSFGGTGDDVRLAAWVMWGLEGAARTGAVRPPAAVPQRFRAWLAPRTTEDPGALAVSLLLGRELGLPAQPDRAGTLILAGAEGRLDPFLTVAAASGLLLSDPYAYRLWNEDVGRKLVAQFRRELDPSGVVREGDPVGDTALRLLALQVAYRTY